MGKVMHFEIASGEPEKTIDFYQKIFGWKFEKWDGPMPYWMITTGPEEAPGINGGMSEKGEFESPRCTTIDVDDLDKTMEDITKSGGQLLGPKTAVPGIGWMTYFKDIEGNTFGIMQDDPNAK